MPTVSLVLLLFISYLTILTAQPDLRYAYCFHNRGKYTNTSSYQSSFNVVVSELNSNTQIDYGFYNLSHGQNPDRVSLIGLCRGDVKPNECRSCLNNASILVPKSCPNQKEAMGGYDECFLRYSNRSIFGVMETDVSYYLWNLNNATEADKYNQVVSDLLGALRDQAASGDSVRKYAAGNESVNFQTVYGAVQCTPDLSQQDCYGCLTGAISEIPNCCSTKTGGRIIKPSCNIRYDNYRFYDTVVEDSTLASPPTIT
ncbi:cysteine-rich repeat secretory protein 38-like [Prosopis cineraria]|uniref:cysteine-rich repeat secretory protein 38-like n=1 Tax=Prosopis cineraria TaxID=364024 RepID=UPI0024103FE8|nr:cysteine-rich repeat secretory protein 38-like [Prosopis cineraria]